MIYQQTGNTLYHPKNSVAIFRGTGFGVFGLLNVPKNLKIGIFGARSKEKLVIFHFAPEILLNFVVLTDFQACLSHLSPPH